MKNLTSALLVVAGIALAVPVSTNAATSSAPLELKDIRIGESTLADVEAKFPGAWNLGSYVTVTPESYVNKQCGSSYTNTDCRSRAFEGVRVAGATPGTYSFNAVDGKVESISVTFNKTGFSTVRDALIIKYGEPSEKKINALQNRAGASFESQTLTWSRPDGEIHISEIGSKVDESRLMIYSDKYKNHLLDENKKKAAEGAKKL